MRFFTLNLNPRLNFRLHIKAFVRGITLISCQSNFRFTTSYNTKKAYFATFTSQDILNEENGGTTISDFEDEDPNYDNRQRLQVYFTDAKSFLKGKRVFLDHF
jgi:hypothetical protein